jgi:hypothetical protein
VTGRQAPGRKLLLVSTVDEVGPEVRRHVREDDTVKVVVPVTGEGLFDWLSNDETGFERARTAAGGVADELPAETVEPAAGESDVALAIRDALAEFPADEILFAVPHGTSDVDGLLEAQQSGRGRTIDGIPVRVVPTGRR